MEQQTWILIAEDNAVNRKLLRKILESEYQVWEASSGDEALEMIRQHLPELSAVILDLNMPGMDGFQILRHIASRDAYRNLPILVATGDQNHRTEAECLKLGAWDFVSKPYEAAVLQLRLRNIIGRSRSQLLQQVRRLAQRDSKTDLYNRDYFMHQTKALLRSHPQQTFALVRMDIDRFRLFNAFFGCEEGDRLLRRIGDLLRSAGSASVPCVYGRIESDVFCICEPYEPDGLERQLAEISRKVGALYDNYRIELSFGVCIISDPEPDVEKMYSRATEAARKCKDNYNLTWAFYDEAMDRSATKAQRIVNEMEHALKSGQFIPYLQPKYVLADSTPCGAEMLVRWVHPQQGMISPCEFIPLFEQNGFILQLVHYMWEQACVLLKKWSRPGAAPAPLSVNVSRVSLYDPHIVEFLTGLTQKYGVPAALVNLEITESAYMSNPELMRAVIDQLRASGFVILMDDFGSGYSSLNTLKDIDVDILKIDMKFLPTGANNAKSEKILASVTRMAGWLGIPVVVEGVETQEQKEFLESIGCSYVQGYYFARPMAVPDYERLVAASPAPSVQPAAENLSDLDALWSSDPRINILLKGVSTPFAIYTYDNQKTDILRMNEAFLQEFGYSHPQEQLSRPELLDAFARAVADCGSAECECLFFVQGGQTRWFRIKLLYIRAVSGCHILSGTFSDVTSERKLEMELNRIFSVLRGPRPSRPALLIADDSELSRNLLSALFESDYEILRAADGAEALELLSRNADRIAVILLDLRMPVMDGWEFLARKNQMEAAGGIPVVVISAEDSESQQINMLENGVNDYVTKPFIPEVVVRRVKNVLEYQSRFHLLLRESQQAGSLPQTLSRVHPSQMTAAEMRCVLTALEGVFDHVRLVDPRLASVLTLEKDGTVSSAPYSCFRFWNREERCENCTSLCALDGACLLSKCEFMADGAYYVISHPLQLCLPDGSLCPCVLEIINPISGQLAQQQVGGRSVRDVLAETQRKIYTDELTSAFNRRYFDEMLFLYRGLDHMAVRVALILMDMTCFKQVNDQLGHLAGDEVLERVAQALIGQVRQQDSVIRYGGDEFIIILTECGEEQAQRAIQRFEQAVSAVRYGPDGQFSAQAEFGYAYTDHFVREIQTLRELFLKADANMYRVKKQRRGAEDTAES